MKENTTDYIITIITNMAVIPFWEDRLISNFQKINKKIKMEQYDIEGLYEENEDKYEMIKKANCIVIWLNFSCLYINHEISMLSEKVTKNEILENVLCVYKRMVDFLRTYTEVDIYAITFDRNCSTERIYLGNVLSRQQIIDLINCELFNAYSNEIQFIDINYIIAEVGMEQAYSMKNDARWGNPYSIYLNRKMSDEIYRQYLVEKQYAKKCIILDCDGVLWGEILSESGKDNIVLNGGQESIIYTYFQKILLELYYHGIILAVCSKNDLADVKKIFRDHPQMILKEEHISCFKVNWEDKVKNIIEIAESLNINLNSMLFIDDSLEEIEGVKFCLPDVETIHFNKNTILQELGRLNVSNRFDSKEVLVRQKTYKTNEFRIDLQKQVNSYEDYLRMLNTKVLIEPASEIHLVRISELSNRTNKCTNGRRLGISDIKKIIHSGGIVLYVSVSDKFSDLGIAGAIVIKDKVLELFCLSCRVLGRNIEKQMISYIKENYEIEKVIFVNTSKNMGIKKDLLLLETEK